MSWKIASMCLVCMLVISCSDSTGSPDDGQDAAGGDLVTIAWVGADSLPTSLPAGRPLTMTVEVLRDGVPLEGAEVVPEVIMGGGSVEYPSVVTEADGLASFDWNLGMVPVRAAVRASVAGETAFVDHVLQVEQGTPIVPQDFGGIDELLLNAGVAASTEGLAFDDAGNLWLAAGGYLVAVEADGSSTLVEVDADDDGDGLEAPLGMAWDFLRKCLWVADAGSIRKVTVGADEGENWSADSRKVSWLTGLVTPNSVAINDNRYVYFSDSCTGKVYRFEPDGESQSAEIVAEFDLLEQGGPNGLAFDDSGRLWITTENVALLCPDSGADVTRMHGGLYYVDIGGSLPAEPVARLEEFAMYGDGLAFDGDGNMYVIFDRFDGFTLTSSGVWLVPETGDPLLVASAPVVDGAAGPDRLIANMAFGGDDFYRGKVYFSLLAVPLVTSSRGAMTAWFGTYGRSLLPSDLPE